jgi:hypothetical protein
MRLPVSERQLFAILFLIGLAVLAALKLAARTDRGPELPLAQAQVPAAAQQCTTVKPRPIERPDGYTTHPYGRKKDEA